jgi:hypothetical protein
MICRHNGTCLSKTTGYIPLTENIELLEKMSSGAFLFGRIFVSGSYLCKS